MSAKGGWDGGPAATELEVSVFGPGVGEGIAVHLCDGQWLIVDSCRASDGQPAALRYLRALGVDVATAISWIVATHWHDDHVRGLAEIYCEAKSAAFACSAVISSGQALEVLRLARAAEPGRSGVDELSDVFAEAIRRAPNGIRPIPSPVWAGERTLLLRDSSPHSNVAREILALSPSQVAQTRGTLAWAERHRTALDAGRRLVSQEPNETSVVLTVRVGGVSVLLGADLEDRADPRDGWSGVHQTHAALQCSPSVILKVPHHGSDNADHPAIWNHLVLPEPVSVLTPFRPQRPRDSDIARIRGRTSHLYQTAPLKAPAVPSRRKVVERTIRDATRAHGMRRGAAGHVRVRIPAAGGIPSVAVFDGAFQH